MKTRALEKYEIRISSEEKALLQLAASLDAISLSAFIRKAAVSAAKDSLNKNGHYVPSARGELVYALDNGFVLNKLKEARKLAEQIESNSASNVF